MSRNYLEAFIIALMSLAFGFFLTWPKYVELQDFDNKIAEKNAEIKNRQDYYNNLKKISDQLENYQENLGKIKSAFPTNPDAPALMSFVQAAAMQSGLIMKGVNYSGSNETSSAAKKAAAGSKGDSAVKQTLQQYTVATELTGSYESFKDFLSRIEQSSRMIGLDQIEVSAAKKDQKNSNPKIGSESQEKLLEYTVDMDANYYR